MPGFGFGPLGVGSWIYTNSSKQNAVTDQLDGFGHRSKPSKRKEAQRLQILNDTATRNLPFWEGCGVTSALGF